MTGPADPPIPLRELLMRILLALERLSPPPQYVRPRPSEPLDEHAVTVVTPAMRLQWEREDEAADHQNTRPLLP